MDSTVTPVIRAYRPLRVRLLRSGLLLVIFMAGSIAGYCVGTMQLIERLTSTETPAAGTYKTPEKFTEWLLAQWRKDLSLTSEQFPVVEKIVRRHHEAFDKLREEVQPKFAREMANMDREMRAVLDESQKVLWEKRMERWRNHRYRAPNGSGSHRGAGKDGAKFAPSEKGRPEDRGTGNWSPDGGPQSPQGASSPGSSVGGPQQPEDSPVPEAAPPRKTM